jgi:SAM-dependent methyltransferase
VKGIFKIDLADKNFEISYADLLGKFDTVFALNVVEHIEDDMLAVKNCHRLLSPGGRLLILMPAYPSLYSPMDKELQHYRRYTRSSMAALLSKDFKVLTTWYFNLAGIFGWWMAGSVLRSKRLTNGQMKWYDRLVPLFRLADRITFHIAGLSVIGVGKKKE